jgi:hypothetical protein
MADELQKSHFNSSVEKAPNHAMSQPRPIIRCRMGSAKIGAKESRDKAGDPSPNPPSGEISFHSIAGAIGRTRAALFLHQNLARVIF